MRTACLPFLLLALLGSAAAKSHIQVAVNEAGRRVDVLIDGKPFTSYIWPTTLKKPTLYPIRTARGTVVTRGFPLDPRKGERVDHPHHVGLWLNHGDVNGLDFWNNSDAIPAEQAPKMGTILHRRVIAAKSGAEQGELKSRPSGSSPTRSRSCASARDSSSAATATSRTIDRLTTLTALDQRSYSRTSRKDFSACGSRAGSNSPATSRRCSPTRRARRPPCQCSTTRE